MDDKNTLVTEQMERVDFKIRGYARFFAFIAPHIEEDDLYQEAMLKLYERYCQEPTFSPTTSQKIIPPNSSSHF